MTWALSPMLHTCARRGSLNDFTEAHRERPDTAATKNPLHNGSAPELQPWRGCWGWAGPNPLGSARSCSRVCVCACACVAPCVGLGKQSSDNG